MAVNSKNKGNSFERKMAKTFSDRFSEYTGKENSFRRNIDSGSFFGGTNEKRMASYDLDKAEFGDIVSPKNFRFSLECKHYKTPPSFSSLLTGECKQFDIWIKEAEQDAENSGRNPCIIMKFNNVKESVMIRNVSDGLPGVMFYKAFKIVLLETFLDQQDDWFFKL